MTKLIDIKVDGYEGLIKIRPMRNVEKFAIMQDLGMDLSNLQEMATKRAKSVETKIGADDLGFNLSSLGKMVEKAGSFIESVDLKNGDVHFQSWDDLDYASEALSIQLQVVNIVFGMGK